ncbi:MAG TPA: VCBS repeat-containing protein, partial [Elusimicrobiota bacterium]|nr:VCBS repeat-containing protein [Elusimicrobiota bacterium]
RSVRRDHGKRALAMGYVLPLLAAVLRALCFGAAMLPPSWWAAGRIQDSVTNPFFRLLCAIGLALFDYIIVVNLAGRLFQNSIAAVALCLALNAAAGVALLLRRPRAEFEAAGLLSSRRSWTAPVLLAFAFAVPQWFVAVSTNFWDEAVASAIHITAPNQFAEGVFPPRHNALPDVPIKYHYGFIILSGTAMRLLGLSANVAIDVVSTFLWLFTFLFVYFWFRELEFDALEATWAAFALLLGGGLAWLYLPRLEAYSGVEKVPSASALLHRYDPASGWLRNLIQAAAVPSQHLRNADGTLSSLPWDIAAQFQQHAVSLGIALTAVGLYLFVVWRKREDLRRPLLAANVAAFSVIFLGHAVFGTVAAVAAGLCLLIEWARRRTWPSFLDGLLFGAGVSALALLHGGMLSMGPQYGGGGFTTLRRSFGYSAGGLAGFIHWNLAGFGLPLILAIAAVFLYPRRRDRADGDRSRLFTALLIFAVVSYLVPQIAFYSSETYGIEQFTEISKFFFSAHFGLALLSAYGLASLRRVRRWWLVAPCFLAAAVSPVLFCYANSVDANGAWLGFYRAPYFRGSVEEQMGTALKRLKKSSRDVFFDASADERRHSYLSELLEYGGSVFTMTPSAYERTGIGFRLSQATTGRRYVQNGRIARLLPGAAEAAGCTWYYCRPLRDTIAAPLIVRSRFAKLVAEGGLVLKAASEQRALYAFEKPTGGLDRDIERYWSPKVVAQTVTDCDGKGRNDLVFYDYAAQKVQCGRTVISLPERARGEFATLYVARFLGGPKTDFLVGRMLDTDFRLGTRIDQNVEYDGWGWNYLDANGGDWLPEYVRWYWDQDVPLVGDLDHTGYAAHLAYRRGTGEWLQAPDDRKLPGPKVDEKLVPVPFLGRFFAGSKGDLGLWSLLDGMVTLKSLTTGQSASFRWGGTYGFILVPGDYDGIGRDEIGIYNQENLTWYWRALPDGAVSFAKFGTKTGIPVPWDYDHDGRLDLAYWEPKENKIYVSFDRGRSVGLVVKVPPHSIPAFVNMH